MKLLLIGLSGISLLFYIIGGGILMTALKTEDVARKAKAGQILAVGKLVFTAFFITVIFYILWNLL